MILSKANLTVGQVASKSAHDRGLNGVRLEPDGATAAGNGKMLMAVGPADADKVRFPETAAEPMEPSSAGLLLPLDLVDKAAKLLPRDSKRLTLQHVVLSRVPDPARVGLTSVDIKGDPTTNAALPKGDIFPDWKDIIRGIKGSGRGFRVCLNRADLIDLLRALESACPNRGDANPVFMEFSEGGSGVIVRCLNHDTGQHAIGALNAYKLREGQWMEHDSWERSIFTSGAPRRVPPRKREG